MVSVRKLLFVVALIAPIKAFGSIAAQSPWQRSQFPAANPGVEEAISAFEEKDIQCQDPHDPSNKIILDSSLVCNEFEDCFQAIDERRDLCGNIEDVQLRTESKRELSVQLAWEVVDRYYYNRDGSAEERRAAIYGPKTSPDGYLLTWKSDKGSSTIKLPGSRYHKHTVPDLEPWTNYTFFLRPYISSRENALGYRIGKASIMAVKTRISGPQNVTLTPLDGNRAIISWEPTGYTEYFQVSGIHRGNILTIEASNTPHQTYSIVVTKLLLHVSDSVFVAEHDDYTLRSCVHSECSNGVPVMLTPVAPGAQLTPSITSVAAVSGTSLVLKWTVKNDDAGTYDGFALRYCVFSSTLCHETTVGREATGYTLDNLHPNTTYGIKLHLRLRKPGNGMTLSKPAQAVVSTWSIAPVAPVVMDLPLISSSDSVLYAWTLQNSSLGYMQYSLNGERWQNCTETHHCAATYTRPDYSRSFAIEGTIKMWSLRPFTTYTFLIRACNRWECGANASVQHTTQMREPSEPRNLQVTSFENGTAWIQWEPPSEPRGPLDGYEVNCHRQSRDLRYIDVTTTETLVSGIPEDANCTWSVVAYHYTPEGHLLRGTRSYYRAGDSAIQSTASTR